MMLSPFQSPHDMFAFAMPTTDVVFHPRKHTKKTYAQQKRDARKRNNKRKFNSNN